ncbi:MAG: cytochrome P450 [Chloroflexota bacterium]
MTTPANMNITSAEFKANPYPFYARLRAEEPVIRVPIPGKQFVWLVTRYDDVAAALKDERFAKNRRNARSTDQLAKEPWMPAFAKAMDSNMLDMDDPDHSRLRGLVHKAFTPKLMEGMRERVQTITDELLDAAQARGEMDLIHDFALPLPVTIIADMLGVPPEDRMKFHKWSNGSLQSTASDWGKLLAIPNIYQLIQYVRRLIEMRRADPRDDLTSALIAAEESGDQLSADELLAMIVILLIAGHETTVNLIGNGMLALMEYPDQMIRLRDDPALIRTAIEEMLRFYSPVETSTERYAREDITLQGVTIPRGDMVFAAIASANRDERQFDHPNTFDITRDPNRHLAFGQGMHYCVGAPLARIEGQIAINTLLCRMPDIQMAVMPGALRWNKGLTLRGLKSLPVTFAKKRATA